LTETSLHIAPSYIVSIFKLKTDV